MTTYTDAMIAELQAAGPIDNAFALDFAERHDISVQSVRQKAGRDESIGYIAKPKTRKDGTPVERKADIVIEIAALVGKDADLFETLGNANRQVLVDLREALQTQKIPMASA